MDMKQAIKKLALLSLLVSLHGCAGVSILKEADSFNEINSDEVLIVGTIELTPKLGKDEQILSMPGVFDLFNAMDTFRNRCLLQVSNIPEAGGFKTMINPKLSKTFFFKIPRNSPYIVAGNITVDYPSPGTFDRGILLPTHFKLDIRSSDSAIYIGHLKYTRDDFNSVTKVRLVDNYKTALGQFRKKYGSSHKLRKSLVQPIS